MKGILFTPDNIKAIVDLKKTQTRRLAGLKEINKEPDKWRWCKVANIPSGFLFEKDGQFKTIHPRYRVGEVVYIKEAFIFENTYEYHEESLAPKDRPFQRCGDDNYGHYFLIPHYKISEPEVLITDGEDEKGRLMTHWKSPLFMPAWAARYFIKITDVQPQRVQDMTEEDAIAEGIMPEENQNDAPPAMRYAILWDSINKKPGTRWQDNPWVWVISFKRVGYDSPTA